MKYPIIIPEWDGDFITATIVFPNGNRCSCGSMAATEKPLQYWFRTGNVPSMDWLIVARGHSIEELIESINRSPA